MNKMKMAFGIGIVLAILAVLPAMAAAGENVSYFVPQHSSAETGEHDLVTIYFDVSAGSELCGAQIQLQFDPEHAYMSNGYCGLYCPPPAEGTYCWGSSTFNYGYTHNGSMWIIITKPQVAEWQGFPVNAWVYVDAPDLAFPGPMTVKMCDCYVMGNATGTPGESRFDFGFEMFPEECPACQQTKFSDRNGPIPGWTHINGTFTHIGGEETYTTTLEPGWNLISMPLDPEDNSTAVVLTSLAYDAVWRLNATSHEFESELGGTMDPGIGYFVNVTASAQTWSYSGTAYISMSNNPLKEQLNMIGWLNCSMDIVSANALSSISGNYWDVVRLNATSKEFEPYVPVAPEDGGFNKFTMMERGTGYYISMKQAGDLSKSC